MVIDITYHQPMIFIIENYGTPERTLIDEKFHWLRIFADVDENQNIGPEYSQTLMRIKTVDENFRRC